MDFRKYFRTAAAVFLLILVFKNSEGQFAFSFDGSTSKYSEVENSSEFFGVSEGKINLNVFFNAENMDTSVWRMITNTDNGKYSMIQNKVSYNGIDSGLIKIPMIYLVNGFSFDTLRFARKDTAQDIFENWTFQKNVLVNGILNTDTITNSSGSIVLKSSSGNYLFSPTNSSHRWMFTASGNGEGRLIYSENNNGLRITNTNTIYPNLNNDGDIGTPNERYRTAYLGTSMNILGTGNKIKTYYDATHGIEISANATGGTIINNITATSSDIFFQLGGTSKIALSNYSSKNVFRPIASNVLLGDENYRWGQAFLGDDLDITWHENVDAGFLRGETDTGMTGIYLRSSNGTKYYITVDDSGAINTSLSPF